MPSSSSTLPRVPLRGYERMMTMADNASVKIAHVMLLRGSADAITAFLRHAPHALALTFNKHPRMRAKQVRGEFAMAEVHPATVSATQIVRDKLFEVREVRERQNGSGGWQQFVERECEVPFDRYASFPFYVRAWLDPLESAVRVVLFSDHYMSDGISGLVVLNDVLAFASLLSRDKPRANAYSRFKPTGPVERCQLESLSLPLPPSLHDLWLRSRGLLKWLMSKAAVALFGKHMYRRRLQSFTPAIPIRADQRDFQIPVKSNSSSVLYAQGTHANMRAALTCCKREHVTFFGALAAAVSVAYFAATREDAADPTASPTPFTLAAGVDYNMRGRVRPAVPETHVGAYMCVKEIEQLSKHGVVMQNTCFWDLARRVKRDTDAQVESFTMPSQLLMLDGYVHARTRPEFFDDLPIPNSVVSDVGISSLGKYPHRITHAFRTERGRHESLSVASIHFHSSTPHLGPAVGVYVASVDSLCYTMKHKYDAVDGDRLFAALVASAELIGRIGATETMLEVARRVREQL